ncbi:hypothetical protein [Clostridium lundense]|uniref:hypothetical protein n=1 Tax=Clostridium lundense TaxID=319475 RepID=UPI000480B327|nr:hypothetical protein [Clostridium lundense]
MKIERLKVLMATGALVATTLFSTCNEEKYTEINGKQYVSIYAQLNPSRLNKYIKVVERKEENGVLKIIFDLQWPIDGEYLRNEVKFKIEDNKLKIFSIYYPSHDM